MNPRSDVQAVNHGVDAWHAGDLFSVNWMQARGARHGLYGFSLEHPCIQTRCSPFVTLPDLLTRASRCPSDKVAHLP